MFFFFFFSSTDTEYVSVYFYAVTSEDFDLDPQRDSVYLNIEILTGSWYSLQMNICRYDFLFSCSYQNQLFCFPYVSDTTSKVIITQWTAYFELSFFPPCVSSNAYLCFTGLKWTSDILLKNKWRFPKTEFMRASPTDIVYTNSMGKKK